MTYIPHTISIQNLRTYFFFARTDFPGLALDFGIAFFLFASFPFDFPSPVLPPLPPPPFPPVSSSFPSRVSLCSCFRRLSLFSFAMSLMPPTLYFLSKCLSNVLLTPSAFDLSLLRFFPSSQLLLKRDFLRFLLFLASHVLFLFFLALFTQSVLVHFPLL